MTMVARVCGGKFARLEPSFMIFQNESRNYPIRGVPELVPGVAYRTGPKRWMDKKVMFQYLKESRVIYPDSGGHQRALFMDNCGGQKESPEQQSALQQLNAVIRKLPKNSRHLCQPCESWIIQMIKQVWTEKWELEKIRLIELGAWRSGPRSSGKLSNPGKIFLFETGC